jgi:hypothetical protein
MAAPSYGSYFSKARIAEKKAKFISGFSTF